MDYTQLSDFEINKRVALSLGYRLYKDGHSHQPNHVTVEDGRCGAIALEYCNSPADAWPIIVENRISIRNRYESDWKAENEWGESRFHVACNPLRAAMIVFLMMQESKNANS